MKKLLAAWLCVAVVACAVSSKRATMAPAQNTTAGAPAPQQPMPGDNHAEIERLSAEIDQERERMSLPAPAPQAMTAHTPSVQAPAVPPHDQDPTCHPGPSETCSTSCTLSDSICKNSKRICELANGMPDDTWAADKCATASQSCDDAHKRCCACS